MLTVKLRMRMAHVKRLKQHMPAGTNIVVLPDDPSMKELTPTGGDIRVSYEPELTDAQLLAALET